MLKQEIIDASKRGDFTIYAIDTIEEGIEILTGVKAGSIEEEGTIFNRVNRKLEDFYSSLKDDKDERDCKEDKE
jgi:predicted ATP-dependent protease